MGIQVDGSVSFQRDGGVTEAAKSDGGTRTVANTTTAPSGQNTVVPFQPDVRVVDPPPRQTSEAGPSGDPSKTGGGYSL